MKDYGDGFIVRAMMPKDLEYIDSCKDEMVISRHDSEVWMKVSILHV